MKKYLILLCVCSILLTSSFANGLSTYKKWSLKIDVEPHFFQHFFANDKVYISTYLSQISCINILTGEKLWNINNCCTVKKVIGDKVFILSFSPVPIIICVDENNGNVLWKLNISNTQPLFADDSVYAVQQDLDDKYMICKYDLNGALLAKHKNNNVAGYKIEKLDDGFLYVEQLTSDYYYENVNLDKNTLEFKGLANHLPEVRNLLDSVFIDKYCIVITKQSKNDYLLSLYDKKVESKFWSINIGKELLNSFHVIYNNYLYITTMDNEFHKKLYCINTNNGKIIWMHGKDLFFECQIRNNCLNIIELDYYNSVLFLYKLDLRTGETLKATAFSNNEIRYNDSIINGKLYTSYKQKDKVCFEVIDIDTHKILNAVESTFKSRLVEAFTNHLLVWDDFGRKFFLINLETNQSIQFSDCNSLIFYNENTFLFYNYKDKVLECHVTSGDL